MKRAAVILALAGIATPALAQAVHDSPFYCDLSGLSATDRAHKDQIGKHLAAVRLGVQELRDGYAFEFPGDTPTLQALTDWMTTERLCCPFFDLELHVGRENGTATLRLTGRNGTKDFIKADFGRWLK
jgi:hypothetical protein